MATKFGRIDYSEVIFEEQKFHKSQNLTSASEGVHLVKALKDDYKPGSTEPPQGTGLLSDSGSHWASIHTMFYSSGSSKINSDERTKFNTIYHNFNQFNDLKEHHNNKFYSTASIFYIPQ